MNMHLFYNRTFLFVMLDVFSDFDFALKVEGGTPSVRHEGWGITVIGHQKFTPCRPTIPSLQISGACKFYFCFVKIKIKESVRSCENKLYSVFCSGVILYRMLHGRLPFPSDSRVPKQTGI